MSLVPFQDLRRLLKEDHWSLQDELRQAFYLHGTAAPVDALFKTLAGDEHGKAIQALKILAMLHQEVPVDLLFAHYAHEGTGIGSQEAEWGRALLQYRTRLPAETLITIACECVGYIEDYDDEDIVEMLGKLGEYIVDALLAKLPTHSVIDFDFLPRIVRAVYDYIPEEKLLAALQTSEGDRYAAAGILAVAGDDRYLPMLLSLLEGLTEQPVAYCKILYALAKFGERFPLDALLTALQHEYKLVREAAVRILQNLSPIINVSNLVAPLKAEIIAHQDDPEPERSWYAGDLIEALGLCREYAPIEFLVTLLEDECLSDSAGKALAMAGQYVPFEVFFTMLRFPNRSSEENAIIGISRQKKRVPIDRLLTLLSPNKKKTENESNEEEERDNDDEDEWNDKYIAMLVIDTLLELDEYASVNVLEMFLQHEDERVRQGASKALAELEARPVQDRLIRTWLGHDDDFVRQSVLKAQVALGEQAPFAIWIAILDDEGPSNLRKGAVQVLDALAKVVPARILALALEYDRPWTRMARLHAWSVLGQVDEIISAAHSDKDSEVRQRAIEILGDLGHPAAIEPLTQLLREDDDSRLLLAIIDALRKLGSAVPPEPLLENCGYREYESRDWCSFNREPGIEAAETLKQLHPEAFRAIVPLAEAMLRGEPPMGVFASRIQSRIADTIGAIGRSEPRLLAILTELLAWPYWQVRMKAAQACGKIRRNIPDAAIQRLLELRFDPQSRAVREAADDALVEILSLENSLEDG